VRIVRVLEGAISSKSAAVSCLPQAVVFSFVFLVCMCQLRVACEPHLRGEGSRQIQPDPACMLACRLVVAACTLCGCLEGL
jgi:hypothetical protein